MEFSDAVANVAGGGMQDDVLRAKEREVSVSLSSLFTRSLFLL